MGWRYTSVSDPSELAAGLDMLTAQSDVPVLVEVFTTARQDSEAVRLMRESNAPRSWKNSVRKRVPPSVRRSIKARLDRVTSRV